MTEASRRQLMELIEANLEQARAEAVAQSCGERFPGLSPLPPGTPIMADVKTAATLFSLSAKTLERLRAAHPDFPAIKVGDRVLYNVFRCWQWFDEYAG